MADRNPQALTAFWAAVAAESKLVKASLVGDIREIALAALGSWAFRVPVISGRLRASVILEIPDNGTYIGGDPGEGMTQSGYAGAWNASSSQMTGELNDLDGEEIPELISLVSDVVYATIVNERRHFVEKIAADLDSVFSLPAPGG